MIVLQNNVYPSLPATATGPDWLREDAHPQRQGRLARPSGGQPDRALHRLRRLPSRRWRPRSIRAERFVHVESSVVGWDDGTHPLFHCPGGGGEAGRSSVRLLYDQIEPQGLAYTGPPSCPARLQGTGIWLQARASATAPRTRFPTQPCWSLTGAWDWPAARPHPPGRLHDPRHERVWPAAEGADRSGPRARWPHSLNTVFATDWYLECAEQLPHDYFVLPPA